MNAQSDMLSLYLVGLRVAEQERYAALFSRRGFAVVDCPDAAHFLKQYEPQQSAIVVVELSAAQINETSLQSHMAENAMRVPVIVLAEQADVEQAVAAMRAGAIDFIELPVPEERLISAVDVASGMLFRKQPVLTSKKIVADRLAKLTEREREVLHHLLQGKLNKEIANELGVSQRTVEGHRSRIREKMHARGIADLIRMVG